MKKSTIGVLVFIVLLVFGILIFQSMNRDPSAGEMQEQEQEGLEGFEDTVGQETPLEETQGITLQELSDNDDSNSCWVAYKGEVYDLTDWLNQHPGEAEPILPNCGTAEQFEEAYNDRHGEKDSLTRNQPIGNLIG